jgi:hypothetical protein
VTNTRPPNDDSPLELLIRAAGDYVQPSDGLRPQVMEAVREVKGIRRDRSRLLIGACFSGVALLLLSAVPLWTPNYDLRGPTSMDAVVSSVEGDVSLRGSDFGWKLVEIFTDVRHQQAESLRSAPKDNPTETR